MIIYESQMSDPNVFCVEYEYDDRKHYIELREQCVAQLYGWA